METQIEVGPEAKLKFEMKDQKIQISTQYEGTDLSAGAFIATSIDQFCHAVGQVLHHDNPIEHGILAALRMGLTMAMSTSDPMKIAAAAQQGRDSAPA